MNSVIATTCPAVYLGRQARSPTCRSTPAPSSRCDPSIPRAPFFTPSYPRPVSGCAAEVSQRIAERCSPPWPGHPLTGFCSPRLAGTKAAILAGGRIRRAGQPHVMYVISGGGCGGSAPATAFQRLLDHRHLEDHPEILEQRYPVLFEEIRPRGFRRRQGSIAAASASTTGSGIRAEAGGLDGDGPWPHRAAGRAGRAGRGVNRVRIVRNGATYVPPHLSRTRASPSGGRRDRGVDAGGGGTATGATRARGHRTRHHAWLLHP